MKSAYTLGVLEDIARETNIVSAYRFMHPALPDNYWRRAIRSRYRSRLSSQERQAALQRRLRDFIYGYYYNGDLRNNAGAFDGDGWGPDMHFVRVLTESSQGEGHFSDGWSIVGVDENRPGWAYVSNGKLTVYVNRELHLRPEQQEAVLGETVSVRFPKDSPYLTPAFYFAYSDVPWRVPGPVVRFYFNIGASAAAKLVHMLTKQLNRQRLPFILKIVNHPKRFGRYDSSILYFDADDYSQIRNIVANTYDSLRDDFHPHCPLFTKRLAPGLSLAEDPSSFVGEVVSFGEHRSRLVMEGLMSAYGLRHHSTDLKLSAILARFEKEGVDIDRPHLNPGSKDIYY